MSNSSKYYVVRDRNNRYQRIPKHPLRDAYYTDTSKSHDRHIISQGLPTPPTDPSIRGTSEEEG